MNLKKIRNIFILLFVIPFTSYSQISKGQLGGYSESDQINTITTAVPFLMISPDARSGAMGDVGCASTPDANSIHWNPSKLAFIQEDMGFSVSYTPWLRNLVDDINLAYLSGYKRLDRYQTVAASLLYFSLGDITFTDQTGTEIGNHSPSEFALDGTYSRKFSDKFSGAVSLRYIYSNLTGATSLPGGAESHPGRAVSSDVSCFYKTDLEISDKESSIMFGLNISNIGSKITYTETGQKDFIPINLRFGGGLNMELDKFNSFGFYADLNKLLVPTPPRYETNSEGDQILVGNSKDPNRGIVSGMFGSFSDAPNGFKEEIHEFTYSLGAEYWYDKQFALRAGYFHEHATKGNRKYFTVGAGLKYSVFGMDIAYLIPTEQRHPLEDTLRFSLVFDFAALKSENNPK